MNQAEQYKQRLIKAHERCQAGQISQEAYKQIERQIIRDLKAYNHKQYGHAMKQGGEL